MLMGGVLLLTGCAPKSTGDPARDVAESFLYACKKGNQDDMIGYSTIGLTDNLGAGLSTEQTLRQYAAMSAYTIRRCDLRPEIAGEYTALYDDTKAFRAGSSSPKYGAGVPLFETLDAVCEVEYTAQYECSNDEYHAEFYVISKDGQWAADMHCLEVMRPRLSAAEIDLCNDAASRTAIAGSRVLMEMKKAEQDISMLEGTQTFTSRALCEAKAAAHTPTTKEEIYQTFLAKLYEKDSSIKEMEQFSIVIKDGAVSAAVTQNDVFHSENGALNYIGYGTWPHPLDCEYEFEQNRDRLNLEFAMVFARK